MLYSKFVFERMCEKLKNHSKSLETEELQLSNILDRAGYENVVPGISQTSNSINYIKEIKEESSQLSVLHFLYDNTGGNILKKFVVRRLESCN